jgi:hypothetical protein
MSSINCSDTPGMDLRGPHWGRELIAFDRGVAPTSAVEPPVCLVLSHQMHCSSSGLGLAEPLRLRHASFSRESDINLNAYIEWIKSFY